MTKKEIVLKLSKEFLNKEELEKLKNVLEAVLEPSRDQLGNEELITRFVDHCHMRNYADSTTDEYRRRLNMLPGIDGVSFLDMTYKNIEGFIKEAQDNKCTPKTINGYIGCYRSFFKWLVDYEYITVNPMNRISKVKEEQKILPGYTREEIEFIRNHFTNIRDRAMIELLLGSGMRVSELVKLKVEDVDWNSSPVTILVQGKGNKQRKIPISETAKIYVKKYLDKREDLSNDSYLIVTKRKPYRPITTDGVKEMFAKESRITGVHMHAHKFRRTYCTELVSHGMSLPYAQKLMGHADPSTTMIYTTVKDDLVFAEFQKVSSF